MGSFLLHGRGKADSESRPPNGNRMLKGPLAHFPRVRIPMAAKKKAAKIAKNAGAKKAAVKRAPKKGAAKKKAAPAKKAAVKRATKKGTAKKKAAPAKKAAAKRATKKGTAKKKAAPAKKATAKKATAKKATAKKATAKKATAKKATAKKATAKKGYREEGYREYSATFARAKKEGGAEKAGQTHHFRQETTSALVGSQRSADGGDVWGAAGSSQKWAFRERGCWEWDASGRRGK